MLTINNFTVEDYKTIEVNKKGIKVYFHIFVKLCVPLSFLLGLIGLAEKGHGYWPTTFFFLLFFSVITIYFIIKENILYRRDLGNKLKYSGKITVLKKSRKRNDCSIYTDAKELNKIDVLFFEIFDQIDVGDELYIEVAKSSKYVFKLEKGILPLINGHSFLV